MCEGAQTILQFAYHEIDADDELMMMMMMKLSGLH